MLTTAHEQDRLATRSEKEIRQQVVGKAVSMLRKRLHLSQSQLASRIGRRIDTGTVSRWERGALLPHPWKRQKLAEIAKTHGSADLAAIFAENDSTIHWRFGLWLCEPDVSKLITLLEITVLNAYVQESLSAIADDTLKILKATATKYIDHLVQHVREEEPIPLFGTMQQALWADILKEHEPKPEPIRREAANIRARTERRLRGGK